MKCTNIGCEIDCWKNLVWCKSHAIEVFKRDLPEMIKGAIGDAAQEVVKAAQLIVRDTAQEVVKAAQTVVNEQDAALREHDKVK